MLLLAFASSCSPGAIWIDMAHRGALDLGSAGPQSQGQDKCELWILIARNHELEFGGHDNCHA